MDLGNTPRMRLVEVDLLRIDLEHNQEGILSRLDEAFLEA